MKKKEKLFLHFVLGLGAVFLILILSVSLIRQKREDQELKRKYSSDAVLDRKGKQEEESRKMALQLVEDFIPAYFLMDAENHAANMQKIGGLVSDELYHRIQDEEYTSGYETELYSSSVYMPADEAQKKEGRYLFTVILDLEYRSGNKDYGIHTQIWDFTCGHLEEGIRIVEFEQRQYVR